MQDGMAPFEAKRFFLGMIYFFVVLFTVGCSILLVDYFSGETQFASPQAPGIVGQRGYITANMIACPKLEDLKVLLQTSLAAAKVNDTVGFSNSIDDAIARGCRSLHSGQDGLVIDEIGYYVGWTDIRMDDDEVSYWIDNRYVGTVQAPNWDLRRLFWGVSTHIRTLI